MKNYLALLALLPVLLIYSGCSSSDGDAEVIVSPDGVLTGTQMTPDELKQKLSDRIDELGDFDVIVTDSDGWDISLWQVRNRSNRSVVTYRGNLGYYSGSNYYEGTAGGVWDYENNIFSCTCLDSSWSGGHINYVMPFQGYTGDGDVFLRGPYYYLENPNRVNRIDAYVFEGGFPYINPGLEQDGAINRPRKTKEEIIEYLTRDREAGLKSLDDQ